MLWNENDVARWKHAGREAWPSVFWRAEIVPAAGFDFAGKRMVAEFLAAAASLN